MRGRVHRTAVAVGLFLATSAVGCAEPGQPATVLAARQAAETWEQRGAADYAMVVNLECYCSVQGRWQLRVEGDRIVGHRPLDEDARLGHEEELLTVSQLYEEVEAFIERHTSLLRDVPGEVGVDVEVDAAGVPVNGRLDGPGEDDYLIWQITEFTPGDS